MDEFFIGFQRAYFVELFFDEILHGFDVVVGDFLNILDALCVGFTETLVDVAQTSEE